MIRTPNDELDRYFNVWSKYQNRNQVRFCRALDKVGYRDVLQDMMGVCDFESDLVRDRLLHTLRYQAADGRAVRQYEAVPGAGQDMRMYMDSSSWIPDTLVTYLRESGDFAILDEEVPYFNMQTQQPDTAEAGTTWEHALRAVRSLMDNTGYHGLCKIGYGDWNDALSGIGGDKGVSVWLSMACVHAARQLGALATFLKRTAEAEELRQAVDSMIRRINEHAWDGEWYIYAINGAGKPIGAKSSPEGKLHLNVNTWSLFTGVARAAGREEQVIRSLEQLATPYGHMLLKPAYTAASRADVGRIADQKPGLFENGSIYLHGESFYLYALIAAGKGDECYRQFLQTQPFALVQDIATGPRHQQSNFTVGPDHPNAGMQLFSNFTGSITWYRRVIERMLGVWADFDALAIQPCPPSEWKEYEVRKGWRGRRIQVRFKRAGAAGCRISLNGKMYTGLIPLNALSETAINRVAVEFA
jgi:cellobionic acid phosphorylase